MKLLILLAFGILCTLCTFVYADIRETWMNFKANNKKTYRSAEQEENARVTYFKNIQSFREHNKLYNSGEKSFSIGPNSYTDLPIEEARKYLLGLKEPPVEASVLKHAKQSPRNESLPASVDWVKAGYVSPVKDQGKCASDYAKAVANAVEAVYVKTHGKGVVHLSAQNILDCTYKWGNQGCKGGTRYSALNYLTHNKGINVALHYPYKGMDQECKHNPKTKVASISGYRSLGPGDENELENVVATWGPVTAAVDGSLKSFIYYSGGIYDDPGCSKTHLNHAVTIVGYGHEDGHDYWLVKNSWGQTWGEKGYMKLIKHRNQCGIASSAIVPIP